MTREATSTTRPGAVVLDVLNKATRSMRGTCMSIPTADYCAAFTDLNSLLVRAEKAEAQVARLREAGERLARSVDNAASARGRMTGEEGRALEAMRAVLAETEGGPR